MTVDVTVDVTAEVTGAGTDPAPAVNRSETSPPAPTVSVFINLCGPPCCWWGKIKQTRVLGAHSAVMNLWLGRRGSSLRGGEEGG